MAILTIKILKKIIENIPEGYTFEYDDEKTISPIEDKVEIDINGEKLILK